MTLYVPRLDPCRSDHDGFKDRHRYEELGLPEPWIVNCIRGKGWFPPDEYYWTPDSFFTTCDEMSPELLNEIRVRTGGCFFDLNLVQQCKVLGVPLEVIDASKMGAGKVAIQNIGKRGGIPIELFALDCFKAQGWDGDRCEGASFFIISHAVRALVEKAKVAYHPQEWKANRKPRIRIRLESHESDVLDKAVEQLNDALLDEWYQCALKTPHKAVIPKGAAAGLTLSQVLACWKALGAEEVRRFCELQMLGFNGMGWPDLTLHRGCKVQFVEVKKAGDKFTHRQPYWFRNFARPMGWDVKVLNLVQKMSSPHIQSLHGQNSR